MSSQLVPGQTNSRELITSFRLPGDTADTDTGRIMNVILENMNAIYARNLFMDSGTDETHVVITYDTFCTGQGISTISTTVPLPTSGREIAAAIRADLIAFAATTYSLTIPIGYALVEGDGADIPAMVESALSLSVQTSTGAVGTQVSSTQDAWVSIAAQVSTTASIAGNAAGDLIVEVAPTNSATAGDWVEKGRIGNSQAISLAIALQSVQIVKGQVFAFVPKGYYVKARSSGSGTVSYTLNTVRKVLV